VDLKLKIGKLPSWIKQYRYPLLILLVGLILMAIPSMNEGSARSQESQEPTKTVTMDCELAQILSQIQGVGKVQVLLTVSAGERTVYQTNNNSTESGIRMETVIISDSQRNEHALIQQILPQSYRGAIIVCQGADSATVKLAVVEAVSRATGLGADSISVLKMK